MDVGVLLIFQNFMGRVDDGVMVQDEVRLALLAEELGFDSVWPPEHHFTDYSACPDNIQVLSYLAGVTKRIRLGTGAVIVPWNDPLRVVEKIVLLDHLSGGRALLGLGRGLSREEYGHFGIEMESSRDRFDEASQMIVDALDTGFIEGNGPWYPQVRTEIRPRPRAGFRDRLYAVGLSPESVEQAARLGARLMTFSQQPWEMYKEGALATYRKCFREIHGASAPAPLTGDLMFCHEDAGRAEEIAMEHMSNYFLSIARHYELMSDHFARAKGYEFYASAAELFAAVGVETAARTYCSIQTWGTPDQILEKLHGRRELIGDFDVVLISKYGGMPFEVAERSLRLFAREVLPALRSA
jgi:alkanesulfonate monooxygenase SsuD/methylene tetrahydromethanopterin reductase-like flavin-dependent oxidoreductase (luciferase family)